METVQHFHAITVIPNGFPAAPHFRFAATAR